MKKFTALLPMKGHSERVPNKNIRDFSGKPLFYWVLDTLLECKSIDSIAIDTDSHKISQMAKSRGGSKVSIIQRPKNLMGDDVSMNKIIAHDLSVLDGDLFFQTHATNPVLKPSTIDNATKKYFLRLDKYDSVFSVTTHQTRLYSKDGKAINHNPSILIPTQDLDPIYEENSNFYIFSRSSFKSSGMRIGTTPQMYPMDKLEAIDIDTLDEFYIAESYINSLAK